MAYVFSNNTIGISKSIEMDLARIKVRDAINRNFKKKEKIMIISMQGNWTVRVKSKSAAYSQRFIISGATSGNGVHSGTPG